VLSRTSLSRDGDCWRTVDILAVGSRFLNALRGAAHGDGLSTFAAAVVVGEGAQSSRPKETALRDGSHLLQACNWQLSEIVAQMKPRNRRTRTHPQVARKLART
jgi:hypothetical protein